MASPLPTTHHPPSTRCGALPSCHHHPLAPYGSLAAMPPSSSAGSSAGPPRTSLLAGTHRPTRIGPLCNPPAAARRRVLCAVLNPSNS